MSKLRLKDPRYRKWAVAAAGAAGQAALYGQTLVDAGVLHGQALSLTQTALAVLTALGVRVARNRGQRLRD